ncbi:regulator of G-protein signaling 3-like [Latimeria chalumnae]|uniref:regulator of G-protein signaling 3-like n=1 Tax=Latimeria chalumnae TaxID=7897 RepID=UPI00313D331D
MYWVGQNGSVEAEKRTSVTKDSIKFVINCKGGSVCRSKGKAGLQRRSTLIKTAQTVRNCGNYQNCTILRPQVPHSSYGTYVTLAPKVLVFPVFVQPFDLCNPLRVLILSEELFYYESRSKSTQVTLFIYTDLMLLTKEDEPGRCSVIQNPFYLHSMSLQEGEARLNCLVLWSPFKSKNPAVARGFYTLVWVA